MGRPPCCDKLGVKKGPWTPEEDIMLVSYVQEHGPANWRAVPTNTGLRRCSKSCRLRWTNYLRPGIRRGDFTSDEEKMIIQLQDLLGNKWAAIASYLPERTDNDIKNYWNTHLKKKLKKLQTATTSEHDGSGLACSSKDGDHGPVSSSSHSISRGQWERRLQTDIHLAKQALNDALSLDQKPINPAPPPKLTQSQAASCTTTPYASSTENIARLLKGWIKNSPQTMSCSSTTTSDRHSFNKIITDSTSSEGTESQNNGCIDLSEAFESLFGFDYSLESNSNISSDFSTKSNNNINNINNNNNNMSPEEASTTLFQGESKPDPSSPVPFSMFENWLLDESAATVCSWES